MYRSCYDVCAEQSFIRYFFPPAACPAPPFLYPRWSMRGRYFQLVIEAFHRVRTRRSWNYLEPLPDVTTRNVRRGWRVIYRRSREGDLEIRAKNAMFGEASEAGWQMYSGPLRSFISTHGGPLAGLSRPDEFILI